MTVIFATFIQNVAQENGGEMLMVILYMVLLHVDHAQLELTVRQGLHNTCALTARED